MSNIKAGGTVVGCPSLILNTSGGTPPVIVNEINFEIITSPSTVTYFRPLGNPVNFQIQ